MNIIDSAISIAVMTVLVAIVLRCVLIAAYSLTAFRPPSFVMTDVKLMTWAHGREETPLNIPMSFYLLPMAVVIYVLSKLMIGVGKIIVPKGLWVAGTMLNQMSGDFLLSGRWLV